MDEMVPLPRGRIALPELKEGESLIPSEMVVQVLRGANMEGQEAVYERSKHYKDVDPDPFPLLSQISPGRSFLEGISLIGSAGSGKSITLHQILANRLARRAAGAQRRTCIWDFKGIANQYLKAYEVPCRVRYLNPLNLDGVGVDVAREVTGPLEADAFAAGLIAPHEGEVEGENGSTFLRAAQAVFSEVVKGFQLEAGDDWTLADVLNGCRSERMLRRTLLLTPEGEELIEDSLGANKQAKGIMFTLRANVNRLMPVAAAMQHSTNISLEEWVSGAEGSVLVLQNVHKYRTNLDPFFRWVFRHLLSLIFSRHDKGERYDFFLDELPQAPFVRDVIDLATLGREYGCGFVAGFQDVPGAQEKLGEKGFGALISCCSTQVYFQNNNPETAEFASKRFGDQLLLIGEVGLSRQRNTSSSAPGMSPGERYAIADRWLGEKESRLARERGLTGVSNGWGYESPRAELEGDPRGLLEEHRIFPAGGPISEQESSGDSMSVSFRQVDRPMVPAAQVLHLPKAGMHEGELHMHALVASTFLGCWQEFAYGMQDATLKRFKEFESFRKRPEGHYRLTPWGEDDLDRLNIPDEGRGPTDRDD